MAAAIREAYSDLFAVNRSANELSVEDARNKLRTLYAGKKSDTVIDRIASTFRSLCDQADWVAEPPPAPPAQVLPPSDKPVTETPTPKPKTDEDAATQPTTKLKVGSLQYHINIVLPETRDQGVYDAIFKSLRDHLG